MDCHNEIQSRLDQKAGFHFSREVKGKDCATCHSDHHGRKFDMVRFDEDNFDHQLTGYELEGAHAKIDCRECHKPDFIDDLDLKKRAETYLGLSTTCVDCHDDYHQNTLGDDCAKCHTLEAFDPASKFDHDETDYPLIGKHIEVDCKECHQTETRNGKEFQRFADVPFANCNACHDDPHENNLGTDCKQCHTEQSFTSHSSLQRFKHNQTGFSLKGKHRQVDCFACHVPDLPPEQVFQNNIGVLENDCVACHDDVHEGRFGSNCAECHTEETFRVVGNLENFDHDLTDFALEGKHEVVDCRKCHISESLTDPLPFANCVDCHTDYHEGEFENNGLVPDCVDCHTTEGFAPSNFSFEAHAATTFPLDGGHLATPCFACHLPEGEEKWQFRNIGNKCVDCHEDVHKDELSEEFYPEQNCQTCHTTGSWKGENLFDHNLTAFTLEGRHQAVSCVACHVQDHEPVRKFAGVSNECVSCHDNVHGSQFMENGTTDCKRCHDFNDWEADLFDHNETRFPLEGKHAEVACNQCHKAIVEDNDILIVEYKMDSFECVDCHQ